MLNANAGSTYAPAPDEAMVDKVCELLAAIREKSRKTAAGTPQGPADKS